MCVKTTFTTAIIFVFAMVLSWVGTGGSPAQAHDPNLARWDVSASGRNVSIAIRISGSGLYSELRKQAPDAAWDTMAREEYRNRVEAFLEQTVDFRVGDRRLPVKVEALAFGHEVKARIRLRRRRATPLEEFTLDLSQTSSRRNQHHLVFVKHGKQHDRFMLHRSNEDGHVLRWSAAGE